MTGIFSGLLVDRLDRRVVSVVSHLLGALSMVAPLVVELVRGPDPAGLPALSAAGAGPYSEDGWVEGHAAADAASPGSRRHLA
ncbi:MULTISPECIES: hypothetical protein [Nocardiopsidaceae]|uniref:Major facilitator superfamily (MFS) profile domain-containing protein n=1 Tax=Streptomonospora nanhaiensis TaxID=1323731 RepID=A0ABY6YTF5_9ACTN|nr:hypothetical protein [Streptomonospora nanhaiensis]WAE75631.1 hypothetical protein OUQ99_11335 [Streptomonospora nanhaiensis]